MKSLYLTMLTLFLSIPLYICAGIVGTYEVKGFDPHNGNYTAILQIQKVNDSIFNALWTFTSGATGIDIGTGVRQGKCLSFVFSESETGSDSVGTQLYKIEHDVLKGPWTHLGGTLAGFEKAKKVRD